MHLVVYGDFNCPYSYLAHLRADALAERGVTIEWRAVEHDTSIPAPSEPVTGELAEALAREVEEVRGLARPGEALAIGVPPAHPNTAAATAAFATAGGSPELRRRIFAALWSQGADIGDPGVLGALGAPVPPEPPPVVATWHEAWQRFERRLVPMLVLPDGTVSRGLGALGRLAKLLGEGS